MSKTKKTETLCHPEAYRFETQLPTGESAKIGDDFKIREEWLEPGQPPVETGQRTGHVVGAWMSRNRQLEECVTVLVCVPG